MELTIREKALLEYIIANTQVVEQSEKSQSVIDYNVMMGNIESPEEEGDNDAQPEV